MEQVGRYRIIQELGQGPRGAVYKAQDQQNGRVIVIKTLRLADLTDTGQRERARHALLAGVQAAEVLTHPNIVTLYGAVEQDGFACLLMEYSAASSLSTNLKSGLIADANTLLHFLRQVSEGLDYASRKGITHGDLKAENILISEGGHALERHAELTDFGLAQFVIEDAAVEGHPLSLASYLSPEQVLGGVSNGLSDQFSLAAVIYEILTGSKPFAAATLPSLSDAICRQEAKPVEYLDGNLSSTVDRVVQKALAKNPSRRFPTCSAFIGTLTIALGDCPDWTPQTRGKVAGQVAPAVSMRLAEAKLADKPSIREAALPIAKTVAAPVEKLDEAAQREFLGQPLPQAAPLPDAAEPLYRAQPDSAPSHPEPSYPEPSHPAPSDPEPLGAEPSETKPLYDFDSVYQRTSRNGRQRRGSRGTKVGLAIAGLTAVVIVAVYLSGWRPEPDMPTQILDTSAGPITPPPADDRLPARAKRQDTGNAQPQGVQAEGNSKIVDSAKTENNQTASLSPRVEPPFSQALPQQRAQVQAARTPPRLPVAAPPTPAPPVSVPAAVVPPRLAVGRGAPAFDFLTEPPGANVVVDGNAATACATPCTLPLLNGRHTATVELNGYAVARRIFNVPESNSLFVTMAGNIGSLLLTSTPSGSEVSVDGAARGRTPMTLRLPAGPHRIKMTYNGMQHEETIQIENDGFQARGFRW